MTTSITPTPQKTYNKVSQQYHEYPAPYCTLQWRRGQLLVKSPGRLQQPYLAAIDTEQSLLECLKCSPVNLVRIDPKLGIARLKLWANACLQAKKPIFVNIPSGDKQLKPGSFFWLLARLMNWLAALVFLLILSPLILGLSVLIHFYSPGSIFAQEWYIGERGKLFQVIKFRTTTVAKDSLGRENRDNTTALGRWMSKYGLDNLPMLFNVLRGEMSLTGLRCWTLEEALILSPNQQRQMNKQPGVIGSWSVEAESSILHLDSQVL
jgi:lipopolysaccharide/colanic/teichoic acid biosynthesis glycosyltransferase